MARALVITLIAAASPLAQGAPGAVVPVYRDLLQLKEGGISAIHARYESRCGASNGPFELLRASTPATIAVDIAQQIEAAKVTTAIEQALARARQALPGADVTICVYAGELSGGLPYLGGVGGLSLGGGRIKIFLHPTPQRFGKLPYTVAHEYHHEVERRRGPGGFEPLDIMLREGKADVFASGLYPGIAPGHTLPLSDPELITTWRALATYEQAPTAAFRSEFMIGRFPDGIRWPGYRLGYEMVSTYARDRRLTAAQVIASASRAIADHFTRTPRGRLAQQR